MLGERSSPCALGDRSSPRLLGERTSPAALGARVPPAELEDRTCPDALGARLVPAEDTLAAGTLPAADVMRPAVDRAGTMPGDDGGGIEAGSVSENRRRASAGVCAVAATRLPGDDSVPGRVGSIGD